MNKTLRVGLAIFMLSGALAAFPAIATQVQVTDTVSGNNIALNGNYSSNFNLASLLTGPASTYNITSADATFTFGPSALPATTTNSETCTGSVYNQN